MHAVDVLRRGLDPAQDHRLAGGGLGLGLVGREHDAPRGGARRGRQATGDDLALGLRIEGRVQKLVELRYGAGLSVRDIGQKLGRKTDTLYKTFARVHAALARCIKQAGGA